MKLKPLVIALLVIGVLGAGSYGLYMSGMQRGMGMNAPAAAASGAPAVQTGAVGKLPQSIAEGADHHQGDHERFEFHGSLL